MLQAKLAFFAKPENLNNAALKKAVGWKSWLYLRNKRKCRTDL